VATDHDNPNRQVWTGYLVAPVEEKTSSVPVAQLFRSVLRGWKIWLPMGLLGGVLGIVLAMSMTRIYRASSVVAIDPQASESLGSGLLGGQLSGLAGLAGISLGGANRRLEYISVLDSRVLASQFIAENELKYQFFADKWDADKKRWTSKKVPTDDDAYRFFSERIKRVDEDRRTGLVTVSMEWKDRHAAARWANLFVTRGNDLLRARAMQEAKSSLEFLDRELVNASTVEIREAMYQLVEAQKKQQMLATVRQDYIFHIIDPAVVADEERFVKPKRLLIAVACAFIGGFLGLGLALYRDRRSFPISAKT
jgi:uncharacterized protein involved in exopolysaccharide biosynthesis